MNSEKHKREINYSSDNYYPWEKPAEATERRDNFQPAAKLMDKTIPGDLIFGRGLDWYFSVIAWPMFILLLAEIGLRVMQSRYLDAWPADIFSWSLNIFRILLFVYLVVSARKQFKATFNQTIVAAVLTGFISGLGLAVFQLFWYLELWAIFNLIGQPLLLAAEGWLISWLLGKAFFKKE